MAIPVVNHILPFGGSVGDPSEGPTGGRSLVEIFGRNFRLPPTPPADGPLGPIVAGLVVAPEPRTVSVTFDGVEAVEVQVITPILLRVVTPISPIGAGAATNHGAGSVDVVVTNLDDSEVPIPGETVTKVDAYTYRRVKLDAASESDLLRLVLQLIKEWIRQVLPEVILTAHTDFDSDTADGLNIIEIAKLPAIILAGPSLPENRFYSRNDRQEGNVGNSVRIRRVARTVDLLFNVVGVSDNPMELINLLAASNVFMKENTKIFILRDESDPSKGSVGYELDFQIGSSFSVNTKPSNSNIGSFTGAILIRGFDFEGYEGFELSSVREAAAVLTQDPNLDVESKSG